MNDAKQPTVAKFMQLLVFTDCADLAPIVGPLEHLKLHCVLYKDLNDPQGIGLLTLADNPDDLVNDLRDLLSSRMFRVLMQRHELTMIGRIFSSPNGSLEDPSAVLDNGDWPWAVWHPMRGTAELSALDDSEQLQVFETLIETAETSPDNVGHIYLKSHGLDRIGNEFVHGLHGRDLGEVSASIQAMKRAAQHTANIASSGPFFVGHTVRVGEKVGGSKARW